MRFYIAVPCQHGNDGHRRSIIVSFLSEDIVALSDLRSIAVKNGDEILWKRGISGQMPSLFAASQAEPDGGSNEEVSDLAAERPLNAR